MRVSYITRLRKKRLKMLKFTLRKHFYRDVQLHGSGILLPDKLISHRVWRNVSMSARWSLSRIRCLKPLARAAW